LFARLARIGVCAVIEQQPGDFRVALLRRGVQPGPAAERRVRIGGTRQIRIDSEEAMHGIGAAVGASFEKLRGGAGLPLFDLRFERAPTGEAVIARHRQQSGGEFGLRIRQAHFAQPVFGQFLEVFERRALGKLYVGHETPSFHELPGVRVSRAGSQGL
jgi:hypothetical protein